MSDIYLSITETPTVVTLTNPLISSNVAQSVTVTNVVSVNVVTMPAITVQAAAPAVTTVAGTVTANVPVLADTVFGVTGADVNAIRTVIYSSSGNGFNNDDGRPVDIDNPLPISGTVTANLRASAPIGAEATPPTIGIAIGYGSDANNFFQPVTEDLGFPVRITAQSQTQPISGTVTANIDQVSLTNALDFFAVNYLEAFPVSLQSEISGTVTAMGYNYDEAINDIVPIRNGPNDERYIPIGPSLNNAGDSIDIPISGTVTANASNGSLTTRFGTPTTANVSFATSAVTNANRKYLLIQNVTTGSNVITVGIGFTPTTTRGIQLTAGAGITFESSYIPTGAVYVLSSVTASNFTILEA